MNMHEGLEINIPVSLMLSDVKAEALYISLIEALGRLICLEAVRSREVLLSFQHGVDSFQELRDELASVFGEHICWGAVRIQPVIQKASWQQPWP